ncbi:MAG: phosphopyruvate hydratase [Candidatus Babeliales bacterium]|jgi:enolase
MKIKRIFGREILDSRGNPTISCSIVLDNDEIITAAVPSGASVGTHEAVELRDGDIHRFGGKGVLKALHNLTTVIAPALVGKEPDIIMMDKVLNALDGTSNKSRLGANAILAASCAVMRAQARAHRVELYELINALWKFEQPTLPQCMFNIINGGLHAQSGLCVQEFMVVPQGGDYVTRLEQATTMYHRLKSALIQRGYATGIGDEGGFAPLFTQDGIARERAALDLLVEVSSTVDSRVALALDVAASSFYDEKHNLYKLHDEDYSAEELVTWYDELASDYPLFSLEDGCAEDDWDAWSLLTKKLGNKMQLVGDDIFVTTTQRIQEGKQRSVATAVLIKPNQIGTVSETIEAIKLCKKLGYQTVISHRSGETNDDFIADLAVGTAAGQLKSGAPVRGERVAKYNRLWEIAVALEG